MRYAILGTTQALRDDGTAATLAGGRLRALLTALALRPGRVVGADALIDEVWAGEPPAGATGALQALVGRLRKVLGYGALGSVDGGYRLEATPDEVDLFRFERLAEEGARALADGDPVKAAGLLGDALALWRGPALADLPDRDTAAVRPEALRLDAQRRRLTAELTLGHADRVLPELAALTAAHPLDEPLRALHLRALRATGRTADALAAYEAVRRDLADRLGTDPSPELRALHAELLNPEGGAFGGAGAHDPASGGPGGLGGPGGPGAGGVSGRAGGGYPASGGSRGSAWPGGSGGAGVHDPASGDPAGRGGPGDSGAPGGPGGPGAGGVSGRAGGGYPASGGAGSSPGSAAPGAYVAGGGAAADGRPDGPARPWAIGPRPPGNARARLTSFVGRETDLAAVRGDLERARLVTITGPGGTGKTRLSQEAGDLVAGWWPDGVWYVELAAVSDPRTVPEAVISALGLRETLLHSGGATEAALAAEAKPKDPARQLTDYCASRGLLLVLDNCEHVIGAAATLTEQLLATCPGVSVLATSREPLGVPGELVRPLDPLPDPTALRLLADRGAAARPGFSVDEDPTGCAELCRRLDGLPLAIELAAARLRSLSPRQLADRLDDRFRLLTGGSRTLLPRQQTLRAVVDWSWDLLTPTERALLRRLSTFRAGWTLEAAESICTDPPGGGPGDAEAAVGHAWPHRPGDGSPAPTPGAAWPGGPAPSGGAARPYDGTIAADVASDVAPAGGPASVRPGDGVPGGDASPGLATDPATASGPVRPGDRALGGEGSPGLATDSGPVRPGDRALGGEGSPGLATDSGPEQPGDRALGGDASPGLATGFGPAQPGDRGLSRDGAPGVSPAAGPAQPRGAARSGDPSPTPDPATAAAGTRVEPPDAAALLASLVDKSLVLADLTQDGARYRMLETISEYAAERLAESGERAVVERRHMTYFREFVRTADPKLRGAGQVGWFERLEREHENLRAALGRAVAAGDEEEALLLTLGCAWFWEVRNYQSERRYWPAVVGAMGPDPFEGPPALVPVGRGPLDDPPPLEGERLLEARRWVRVVELLASEGETEWWTNPRLSAVGRALIGTYPPHLPQSARWPGILRPYGAFFDGSFERLRELMDGTVEACRIHGRTWELAYSLQLRAKINNDTSERLPDALRDIEESRRLFQRLGDEWGTAETLSVEAEAAANGGDWRRSAVCCREGIVLARKIGSHQYVPYLTVRLGSALINDGETEEGERLLRAGMEDAERLGVASDGAAFYGKMLLASVLAHRDQVPEALALIDGALRDSRSGSAVVPGFISGMLSAMKGTLIGKAGDPHAGIDLLTAGIEELSRHPVADVIAPRVGLLLAPGAVELLTMLAEAEADPHDPGAAHGGSGPRRARRAAVLAGAHDRLRPTVIPPAEARAADRTKARLRELLGDKGYEAAYAEGGGLGAIEAVALMRDVDGVGGVDDADHADHPDDVDVD